MTLAPEEIARFDAEGYLFFPSRFPAAEAATLRRAADEMPEPRVMNITVFIDAERPPGHVSVWPVEPRAMNIRVFLDEVSAAESPGDRGGSRPAT